MKLNLGSKAPKHGRDWRPGGRKSEPMFNSKGELNANGTQDALARVLELATAISKGEVMNSSQEIAAQRTEEEKREIMAELASAFNDADRSQWAEIGQMISAELMESADREGFMRRILLRGDVQQGAVVRHRIKRKTTSALVASGPSSIQTEMARGQYLYAPEFEVRARIGVSNMELVQGAPELLDEKFFEAQEQIGRVEDDLFLTMCRAQGGLPNSVNYVVGSYTATAFTSIQYQIKNWGLDVPMILMASDVMSDLLTASTFLATFDPVTQYENIMSGTVARLFGTDIVTDQFRDPRLKVLNSGEIFAFAPPEYVGGYTDRGPVDSVPIDLAVVDGFTGKGWSFSEILSVTVHTGRGISMGNR
jgi:hypothetical protein